MPLGWVDFSKKERSKVLTVLDMLSEQETLDELGVASVRDGFSNLFFPGTSTVQTRAKYFLMIPYIMKDQERRRAKSAVQLARDTDTEERVSSQQLYKLSPGEAGIIGSRSIANGGWVRRTPADIYWAGLRRYDIFRGGNLSRGEYFRALAAQKKQKATLTRLGNRADGAEESEADDIDAVNEGKFQFWNIPTYEPDWRQKLDLKLTSEESLFLKEQIIQTCPDSMLSIILKKHLTEVLEAGNFMELEPFIKLFPEKIRHQYQLALQFSHFVFAMRIVYNVIASDGKNAKAAELFEEVKQNAAETSDLPIDEIIQLLHVGYDRRLVAFLKRVQDLMQQKDFDQLKRAIKDREISLKGQYRAKTCHPGEYGDDSWLGGGQFDYRYPNARRILLDIFEGEVGSDAKSE